MDSIFDQGANGLCQIVRVDANREPRWNVDPPEDCSAGGRAAQHLDHPRDHGLRIGLSRGAARLDARAGKFAVDRPLHGGSDCLDAVGNLGVAQFAHLRGIAQQGLKRGLQAMCQISGAMARARKLFVAGVKQLIDLSGKGQNLARQVIADPRAPPRSQCRDARADFGQGAQADSDLGP